MDVHAHRRSVRAIAIAIACGLAVAGCSTPEERALAGGPGGGRVRLAPDPAFAGARIDVVLEVPGPAADSCRYTWRRNGKPIPEAHEGFLEPVHFSRGDHIEVLVLVPGGEPDGMRRLEGAVRVANTPPLVTRVTIQPSDAAARAELQATVESLDRDGDPLTHTYRWFRNGNPIYGESDPALPIVDSAIGDQIAVEVVANDGELSSPPVRAEASGVDNHPPTFVSQPVVPGPADSVYAYQAVATDADGDPIRYELAKGPAGMVVGPGGDIVWVLPPRSSRAGEYPILIRARDSRGGEALQQYTIRFATSVANH